MLVTQLKVGENFSKIYKISFAQNQKVIIISTPPQLKTHIVPNRLTYP